MLIGRYLLKMKYYNNLKLTNISFKIKGISYNEIWEDIVGYEGFYKMSSLGRIKSSERRINTFKASRIKKELIIKQKIHPTGYLYVNLNKNGISKTFKVHRLVAIAFIPNPENKPEVNHKKGNKLDNRFWMIEWSTPKENCEHRTIKNLIHSKLCPKKVLEIRSSNLTNKDLSEKYNVSPGTISKVKLRQSWWHVK